MKIKVLDRKGIAWVDSRDLDSLIAQKAILGFFRSNNKLVVIDVHPTRKEHKEWHQPERRGKGENNHLCESGFP